MSRQSIFSGFLMLVAVSVLAAGGLAQGKHGGKKHGGGHGDRGKQNKHWNGDHGGKQEKRWEGSRGNDNDRGNPKAWGRQRRNDGSRAFQQQIRRHENNWAIMQQRESERFSRRQQKQFDRDVHRQQADIAGQQRYRQQIYRQQYVIRDDRRRHDNGLHLGWYKNGKAFDGGRPWRSRDDDRDRRRASSRDRRLINNQYVYDPIVAYLPAYQQPYYNGTAREHFVRSLISGFFAQKPVYDSFQTYEVYEVRRPAYVYQQPYRYSNAGYSPVYYDEPYYNDPYYSDHDALSGLGGGGLKSGLLNLGLELLQGFLGTGYSQGLYDGAYARGVYGPRYANADYNPYDAPPEYYSPYVSSLADQGSFLRKATASVIRMPCATVMRMRTSTA